MVCGGIIQVPYGNLPLEKLESNMILTTFTYLMIPK